MQEQEEGYLIEISEKIPNKGESGIINDMRPVIASPGRLAELLVNQQEYTIWSARLIDIPQFKESSKETHEYWK